MTDYHLEEAEEAYRESRIREQCLEAASLVAKGTSREQAVRTVLERDEARSEALESGEFVADEDGVVESFLHESLNEPTADETDRFNVKKIADELEKAGFFRQAI